MFPHRCFLGLETWSQLTEPLTRYLQERVAELQYFMHSEVEKKVLTFNNYSSNALITCVELVPFRR
jgi:hypothetical protein